MPTLAGQTVGKTQGRNLAAWLVGLRDVLQTFTEDANRYQRAERSCEETDPLDRLPELTARDGFRHQKDDDIGETNRHHEAN
ncbi:hypothetical protein Jiend_16270 [Micromonospora endophytica]|nr:hypothetical protein Jiend_16270 [Micromonospora endophytica]